MAYTKEQIEKAKTAETVEELIALAKAEGVELSEEKATAAFAKLHPEDAELSAEELDNVAGGCGQKYKNCPYCGTQNNAGNLYCTQCKSQIGAEIEKTK